MAAAGETESIDARYTDWAVATAEQIETQLPGAGESAEAWRVDFDRCADDLRAALSVARRDDSAHRLARSLGHLTYARRFLAESRRHFMTASEQAGDGALAAHDLWDAASVAQVEMRGELRFELVVAAAERAASAGAHGTQAAVLAEAVSIGTRFPAIFERDVPLERLQALLDTAVAVAPPDDATVQAQLAAARAWTSTQIVEVPDPAEFERAFEAARAAGDAVLMSSALDGLGAATLMSGRFREAFDVSEERRGLLARLPPHVPRAGSEIHDVVHMGVENAVTAGELPVALETATILSDESIVATTAHMAASKPVVALVLTGRFSEAIARGRQTRQVWEAAGAPAARWMAPSVYAVALAFGLRGDADEWAQWRALARERVAGLQTRAVHFTIAGMGSFADARLALHEGRLDDARAAVADVPTEADAWWQERHWYFDAYPWALAAEVAVAAGAPDAEARLAAAQPAGEQNLWAAACLARARGRRGNAAAMAEAVAGWERIGARFERACTLLLMEGRADEARAEFAAMQVRELPSTN
jgi:hypothetical protein